MKNLLFVGLIITFLFFVQCTYAQTDHKQKGVSKHDQVNAVLVVSVITVIDLKAIASTDFTFDNGLKIGAVAYELTDMGQRLFSEDLKWLSPVLVTVASTGYCLVHYHGDLIWRGMAAADIGVLSNALVNFKIISF